MIPFPGAKQPVYCCICCSSCKNPDYFVSITQTLFLLLSFSHSLMLPLSLLIFLDFTVSHALTWFLCIPHLMFSHEHSLFSVSLSLSFIHQYPTTTPEGDFQDFPSPSSGKGKNKPKEPSSHPSLASGTCHSTSPAFSQVTSPFRL